jgi:hypothetical protein
LKEQRVRDWRPTIYDHHAIREQITELRKGVEVTRTHYRKIPHVGELIAWRDRKAYRVVAVEEREQANWDEQTVAVWERKGRPDPVTWEGRELAVRLVPADNPHARSHGYGLYPWASTEQWWPLREQYPTCNDCDLIWPCPCDERTDQARIAMKELDRLDAILPGCCWACNEPITGRHHSVVFDGENLLMPGAGPVIFHTSHSRKAGRGTCRGQAEEYEEKWVAVEPGRQIRLRCTGVLYRHVESSECTQGRRLPWRRRDTFDARLLHDDLVRLLVAGGWRCRAAPTGDVLRDSGMSWAESAE